MSFPVRATTTATNKRQQHQQPKEILKKSEPEYLHVLNLIEKSRRSTSQVDHHRQDPIARFSSRLSSIGQEAMLQTYEDTLLTHLKELYSSERILAVLPRDRKSISKDHPNRLQSIRQAQQLVDQFNRNSSDRDRLLSNYVRWQTNKK